MCSCGADYPTPACLQSGHFHQGGFAPHMPDIALSVTLITHNESRHIAACLKSVAFADEWVVVDSGSTDGTREIAESLGARVVKTDDWPGFGVQKNRALALARGRWVLSIDADERVSEALAARIQEAIRSPAERPMATSCRASRAFAASGCATATGTPIACCACFAATRDASPTTWCTSASKWSGRVARLAGDLAPRHHAHARRRHRQDEPLQQRPRARQGGCRAPRWPGHGAGRTGCGPSCAATWSSAGFLDGRLGFVLAIYQAEGTYYRYLKMGAAGGAGRTKTASLKNQSEKKTNEVRTLNHAEK